jgi:hypothetical protein
MLKEDCYNEYQRLMETYDKIYEKVNIMLAFCGVVLLVILSKVDITRYMLLVQTEKKSLFLISLLYCVATTISSLLIVSSVIHLLKLLKGKNMLVFDSIAIRNEKIYESQEENAALWLIQKYTDSIASIQNVIKEKQSEYDKTVIKVIVSLIAYAVALLLEKGI